MGAERASQEQSTTGKPESQGPISRILKFAEAARGKGAARKGRGREPPRPEASRTPRAPSGGGRGGGAAREKPPATAAAAQEQPPPEEPPPEESGRRPPPPGGKAEKARPCRAQAPRGGSPAPHKRRGGPGKARAAHGPRPNGERATEQGARSKERPGPKADGPSERPRSRDTRRTSGRAQEPGGSRAAHKGRARRADADAARKATAAAGQAPDAECAKRPPPGARRAHNRGCGPATKQGPTRDRVGPIVAPGPGPPPCSSGGHLVAEAG